MGHEEHDAVDLAVQVGPPLLGRREAGTLAEQEALEVIGELIDLAEMMLHAGTGFRDRPVGLAPKGRTGECAEEQEASVPH
jgi:hypothetical protein